MITMRCSIDAGSFSHGNPIPTASKIGPLICSSVIGPRDPLTGAVPAGADAQIANLFIHMGSILEAAAATWAQVAKIDFFVSEQAHREAINPCWVEHFPDERSRPARHTHVLPDAGPVTCSFIAYTTD